MRPFAHGVEPRVGPLIGRWRPLPAGEHPNEQRLDPSLVLVVDDDPSIRDMVVEILSDEGYRTLAAGDGAEALEQMRDRSPAVVLLDMRMPRVDGWRFVELLRERGRRVPIVVMTAAGDARRWSAEISAQGYLAKPFDVAELLEQVRRYATPGRPN